MWLVQILRTVSTFSLLESEPYGIDGCLREIWRSTLLPQNSKLGGVVGA
jgi:hypothetical protein